MVACTSWTWTVAGVASSIKQAGVLNGNGCLNRNGLQKADMFIGIGVWLVTLDGNSTDDLIAHNHRHTQIGSNRLSPDMKQRRQIFVRG